MTSSRAFRCVQAWLQEKLAVWVGEDAPDLASALMVQRPRSDVLRKRPREDALLEAERSHQQPRIELLEEQLESPEAELLEVKERESAAQISRDAVAEAALHAPATRTQRAEMALRSLTRPEVAGDAVETLWRCCRDAVETL